MSIHNECLQKTFPPQLDHNFDIREEYIIKNNHFHMLQGLKWKKNNSCDSTKKRGICSSLKLFQVSFLEFSLIKHADFSIFLTDFLAFNNFEKFLQYLQAKSFEIFYCTNRKTLPQKFSKNVTYKNSRIGKNKWENLLDIKKTMYTYFFK